MARRGPRPSDPNFGIGWFAAALIPTFMVPRMICISEPSGGNRTMILGLWRSGRQWPDAGSAVCVLSMPAARDWMSRIRIPPTWLPFKVA